MRFCPLEPGAKLGPPVKGNCRGQMGAHTVLATEGMVGNFYSNFQHE